MANSVDGRSKVFALARLGAIVSLLTYAAHVTASLTDDPPYVVSDSDDLDGDEQSDLVTADPQTSTPQAKGKVDVRSGDDSQLLVRLKGVASGGKFGFAAWASTDLGNDGAKDVIVGAPDESGGRVYVFQGPFVGGGSGELVLEATAADMAMQSPDADSSKFGERVKAVADLDEDGVADIMIRGTGPDGSGGTEFRMYFFSGADGSLIRSARGVDAFDDSASMYARGGGGLPPCCGDITGADGQRDGIVNVTDLLAVITMWGACPAAPAECPGDCAPCGQPDGQVNVTDMLAVITAWGVCDYDGDGMPDTWEIENGLDPSTNDAGGDADGDGVTNLVEFQIGIDPQSDDTDGDGVNDGQEVNQGTNPHDANSVQPNPDDVIWVKVTIGDPGNNHCAGTFSELWAMRIGSAVYVASPSDFGGNPQTTNKTFVCAPATGDGCGAGYKSVWTHTNPIPLKRGKSYSIKVEHRGTCFTTTLPNHPHPEDYDYTAELTVVSPPGGGTIAPHIKLDPDGLFGTHYDASPMCEPRSSKNRVATCLETQVDDRNQNSR